MQKNIPSFALVMLVPFLGAWGATGHRVVGEIAEMHLSSSAKAKVRELLKGESLAEASTFADEMRSVPEWKHADPWHFVTSDDGSDLKVLTMPPSENSISDLLQAIAYFEKALNDSKRSIAKRGEALRWLVHFVGDLHMPLHVGKSEDRGGNSVQVHWFGSPTNLHHVWDDEVIDQTRLSFSEIARFANRRASDADVAAWQSSDVLAWARESKTLRVKCYEFDRNTTPPQLSWPYYRRAWEVVQQRLLQGGIRLAGMLNRAFSPGS